VARLRLGTGIREREGKGEVFSKKASGGVDVLCGSLRMVKLVINHISDQITTPTSTSSGS
jgi:hypothetical protein